ncbi:MAG: PH domain-containing protein [Candidatus Pacebacteria bacterium]|nr:PH domain-containing protein [Candidatus Paceibacterota bacterium]
MIRLEKNEKIIFIARKHWFMFFTDIVSVAIFLLMPFIALGSLFFIDIYYPIPGNIIILTMFAGSLVLLFLWMAVFIIWTDYYLDILILTNKNVIDVEQRGLFSRELSTFRLDKIQDVTTEVSGLIPTFLKFGAIHIQTAGEGRDFLIRGISKPFDVRHIISKQQGVMEEKLKEVHLSDSSIEKIQKA